MGPLMTRLNEAAKGADQARASDLSARAREAAAQGETPAAFAGDVTTVTGETLSAYRTPNGGLLAYGNRGTALAFDPGQVAVLLEVAARCTMPGQETAPPEPEPAEPERPREGWSRIIPPQKKSHYFVSGRSLCGRYGFPPLPLNPDDYTSPDDCAGCRKRLTLRQLDRAALAKGK